MNDSNREPRPSPDGAPVDQIRAATERARLMLLKTAAEPRRKQRPRGAAMVS